MNQYPSIREYTMNAKSAITLYVDSRDKLKIKDEGQGLSHNELVNAFSDSRNCINIPPSLNILR